MSTTKSTRCSDNERRIARMDVWLNLARKTSAQDESAHVRFVFYWIAYEAAYKVEGRDPSAEKEAEWRQRERFHHNVAWHDAPKLQEILSRNREQIVRLLELRQADNSFWYRSGQHGVRSAAEWEVRFRDRVRTAVGRLDKGEITSTLDDLFRNLAVVRHQIVHGGSAGAHSRGRRQVLLGAALLGALIPRFCQSIKSKLEEDWGEPPFPRVGSAADEECPPPWLASERGSRRRPPQ